jgi:hypothetical protein
VFIRLVKWAMQALDIYTLSVAPLAPGTVLPGGQRTQSPQTVRTKEEKEVLEHFAGVVSTSKFFVYLIMLSQLHRFTCETHMGEKEKITLETSWKETCWVTKKQAEE